MGAAETGFEKVILLLIKQGADVNSKDHDGTSVLDAALANGHAGIARILRDNGAQ